MVLSDPLAEVDRETAADLLCGVTATLEISRGDTTWRDEHFPVLELALALVRSTEPESLRFRSMCLEEDPAFAVVPGPGFVNVITYDRMSFQVPVDEFRRARGAFIEQVDRVLQAMFGWTISDIDRSTR
ncbi:hypothetical protein [Patulibacter medicamentivorans]|uniref:hypothetical protein n=1 Tax=Patulibacter medicamentivorans TaxID=1097667 RepID=UPI001110E944|nr:hypothetical protein [Patulibacter medicamentivorans]